MCDALHEIDCEGVIFLTDIAATKRLPRGFIIKHNMASNDFWYVTVN